MNASEARKKLNLMLKDDLTDVFNRIDERIGDKMSFIQISNSYRYISDEEMDCLRSEGYRVEYNPYTKKTTISW